MRLLPIFTLQLPIKACSEMALQYIASLPLRQVGDTKEVETTAFKVSDYCLTLIINGKKRLIQTRIDELVCNNRNESEKNPLSLEN